MIIKPEEIEILQYRIQREQYSARIYEQMYLWLENRSYFNAAKLWKRYQAEELEHATWAIEYLLRHNVTPEIRELEEPKHDFTSLKEIVNLSFEHEQVITAECEELTASALEWKCFPLMELGLRYNKEQTEELSKFLDLIDITNLSNDNLIIDTYIKDNLL
jgi:ferritin